MSQKPPSLEEIAKRLRAVRSNQPRVTLAEAQAQALRVMQAGKGSRLRLRPS